MGFFSTVLGFCGFGVGISAGLVIGYYFFIYFQPSDVKDPEIRPLVEQDSETLQRMLPEIPLWVKNPDYDRVDWINKFLEYMWPYLDKAICATAKNIAKPIIEEQIPKYKIDAVEFETLTLGSLPPTFQGMKVYVTDEKELIMEPLIKWAGNPNVTVAVKAFGLKATVQVVDLQVFALPRITLKPLVPSFPCFANIYVSLMEKPHIDFGLKLIGADLMSIPGLYRFVQELIKDQVANMYLWPKTLQVPILDPAKAFKRPVGILHVKVVRAMKLRKKDLLGASDPYVKLKLTEDKLSSKKTTVKHKNLNPGWNEEFDMLVKDPETQALEFNVFDWEQVGKHDKMGMNVVPLKELTPEEPKVMTLELLKNMDLNDPQNEKSRGQLVMELTYKPLKDDEIPKTFEESKTVQKAPEDTPDGGGVLVVIVHEAQDVEGKHHTNPYVRVLFRGDNSGKSTVINALLGERYLKEGVVPTTNEITFLCYSELDGKDLQRCERHPDGQLICYLPAPILKDMNIVDTPGTNVILQRQQRLTEEFVPRADLLFFVISADRPLTESEVAFLRYTQQWKKKVVFVLNKADLYQNVQELEEAISFIKENTQKLLNTGDVTLYPVAARSVLEEKLSASSGVGKEYRELSVSDSNWRTSSFYKLENFLYSFLDGSTSKGMERMKLKLGTPIAIAERVLSACETLNRKECQSAEQDLTSANEILDSVKEYVIKMENESISWRRRTLSMIDTTKSRVLELIESTLQLSNLDLVAAYVLKGGSSATLPATSRVQNDILGPALADAQNLLGEYLTWLQSNNAREGRLYKESFEKRWPSLAYSDKQHHLETYELLRKLDQLSLRVIENFSANAASKLFEQEVREVFLGTFGGLGAAGLSASLLTSILPTTLEDLLALGLCSAGGFIAISNFPARRQEMIEKVKKTANVLARELEDAMQKDLLETTENLGKFVRIIGEPYRDAAEERLDKLLEIKDELSNVRETLQTLQVEIQNLHVS